MNSTHYGNFWYATLKK